MKIDVYTLRQLTAAKINRLQLTTTETSAINCGASNLEFNSWGSCS